MSSKKDKNKKIDKYPFPNRNDDIYKNIENIENFEFTHSIVYEFARRNENVEYILNFLNDTFKFYAQKIHSNENLDIQDFDKLKQLFIDILQRFAKKEFVNKIENTKIEDAQQICSIVVETLAEELYETYYIIYKTEEDFSNYIYNSNRFMFRDIELTKHIIETEEDYSSENSSYVYSSKENEYFFTFQAFDKKENTLIFNTVYPKYKTAVRDFTNIKVAINLNLPEKDIVDFIKKVKENYDSNHSIIKTPLELLGEKSEIDTDYDDTKRKEIWADLFFIYDYYNIGIENKKKKTDIEKELQLIFTKIYGVKIMNDTETDKSKKFDLIPYKEYLKKYKISESDLDLDETAEEKYYYTTRSIRSKYSEMKNYIIGKNPKYKTLIYR